MKQSSTWYEKCFTGVLSVGLNSKNVHLLENEAFLFLKCPKRKFVIKRTAPLKS